MNLRLTLLSILALAYFSVSGQKKDSIQLKVEHVESKELLDFFRLEDIQYYKLHISGSTIKKQYFVITSHEFWKGKPVKIDTIVNTKLHGMRNGTDTLDIRVMAKKTKDDTVKFQFHFPGFSTTRLFKTTKKNTYSLRDINANKKQQSFEAGKTLTILAYSLPYEDPKKPGYLYYCELSREGILVEKWGDQFNVAHYIAFKIHLIN